MTSTELKEIFRSAAEVANVVSTDLQPLAFAKAVELLIGSSSKGVHHNLDPVEISSGEATIGKARFSHSRPGPKAILAILLEEGYFEIKRSQGEIQKFLRESKGYEYSLNELSISLLRVIRKGPLRREKNHGGHYLYHASKS
jgi:hypothetical protein